MSRHVTPADLEPGSWWIAHDHPERPVDGWCVWSWDCTPCMIHLVASAHLHGEHYAEEFRVHGTRETTTVAATLAEARAWRAERGMVPL